MRHTLLLFATALLLGIQSYAQTGVAINPTGAEADSCAMLDVSSTTKGLLVPRMTEAQRTAIVRPVKGLLVYQNDGTEGFYYYDGSTWTRLASGTYTESDPVFGLSAAHGISSTNISNWDTAYSWGDHAGLYRPVTWVPAWNDISGNPFHWSSPANGDLMRYDLSTEHWENFAPEYLTSYTETDPIYSAKFDPTGAANGDLLKFNGTKFVKFSPNFSESNYLFNTKYGVKLLARNDVQTDVDFVISPKGNGAILAQQPDGTTAGGNVRGNKAIDLQMIRSSATQVASGNLSIVIGAYNTASSYYSTAIGYQNTASDQASTAIGYLNTASSLASSAIGLGNIASGQRSTAIGDANTASGDESFASGYNNIAQSYGETVLGIYATVGTGSTSASIPTDRLFVIGNGLDGNRSDALTILKNANTTIGGSLTFNGNGTGTGLTLPATRGTSGYVLTTDGIGGTSWTTPAVGTVTGVTGTSPIVSSGGSAPAISISAATTSAAGSMSAADKTKLDGLQAGWNLTGNSGTTPGTDFIGTTDNKALIFKVNNAKSGEINTYYANASFGYQTLNAITTGFSNSANGHQALFSNTTGYQNTAIGYSALYFNTTGYNNTAIGVVAGKYIADGSTANSTSLNSVYLGTLTRAGASGNSNEIVIGYNATGAGSNTVTLGNTSITSTILRGNTNIGGLLTVNSSGSSTSYSFPSTRGASGQVLSTDGIGGTTWIAPAGGTVAGVTGTAPIVSSGGVSPVISITAATASVAGSMSAADKTKLDAITGTNTGDQTIILTGDVVGSGTGSFPAAISASSVTNPKMANMAANSIKVNNAGSAAAPTDLSIPANSFPSRRSAGNLTVNVITDFAFDILHDPDAATVRTTIGAGTGNGTVTTVTGTPPISVATGTTTPAISILPATTSAAGSMSAADKTILDGSTHAIGDSYSGGIVFYIYDGGRHGLIAATGDQSPGGIRWYGGSNTNTRARADGVGAGLKNTAIIIANQGPVDGNEFAATVCNEYSVTVDGVTYGDWYLPSNYELNLLYIQKEVVGGFSGVVYWSSTENTDVSAWFRHFGTGGHLFTAKSNTYHVRAIRAF